MRESVARSHTTPCLISYEHWLRRCTASGMAACWRGCSRCRQGMQARRRPLPHSASLRESSCLRSGDLCFPACRSVNPYASSLTLRVWLGRAVFQQGQGQLCVCHMPDAWLQVLHMLRGCPSPGSALRLDAEADAYEVAPGVHVPHLSPACLRNNLLRWVKMGTTAYRWEHATMLSPGQPSTQDCRPSYQNGQPEMSGLAPTYPYHPLMDRATHSASSWACGAGCGSSQQLSMQPQRPGEGTV